VKEQWANPGSPGKWPLNRVCVCVCIDDERHIETALPQKQFSGDISPFLLSLKNNCSLNVVNSVHRTGWMK